MFYFKDILILLLMITSLPLIAQNGAIQGKVTDSSTGEGVPFADIRIKVDSVTRGAQSDFDGFYSIKPLSPDTVTVTFSHQNYTPTIIQQVPVERDKITFLDTPLFLSQKDSVSTRTKIYKSPLLNYAGCGGPGVTVTKEEIDKIATRSHFHLMPRKTAIRSTGKTYKQKDIKRLPIR